MRPRRARAAHRCWSLRVERAEESRSARGGGGAAARRHKILAANERDMREAAARDASAGAARPAASSTRSASRPWRAGSRTSPQLPDPIGTRARRVDAAERHADSARRVPLGVIGIIYESRPNVTADAGALCLKSGNAVILRGGSESARSNAAIHACLGRGIDRSPDCRALHPAGADHRSGRGRLHAGGHGATTST